LIDRLGKIEKALGLNPIVDLLPVGRVSRQIQLMRQRSDFGFRSFALLRRIIL
jgi:hypothetical protein